MSETVTSSCLAEMEEILTRDIYGPASATRQGRARVERQVGIIPFGSIELDDEMVEDRSSETDLRSPESAPDSQPIGAQWCERSEVSAVM